MNSVNYSHVGGFDILENKITSSQVDPKCKELEAKLHAKPTKN